MKQPILLMVLLVLAASAATADIQTATDPFPGNSGPSFREAAVGLTPYFDIQTFELRLPSGGSRAISIFTNYSGLKSETPLALENYDRSSGLDIDNLFLEVSGFAYAVPLDGQLGFKAGNSYQIGGPINSRTAYIVPGPGSDWVFRPNEVFRIGDTPGTPPAIGPVTVTKLIRPNPTHRIDLDFASLPDTFWEDLYYNGRKRSVTLVFASDGGELSTDPTVVPEPASVLMLGTILLLLASLGVRRRARCPLRVDQSPRS